MLGYNEKRSILRCLSRQRWSIVIILVSRLTLQLNHLKRIRLSVNFKPLLSRFA
jgi:hypothetical protein